MLCQIICLKVGLIPENQNSFSFKDMSISLALTISQLILYFDFFQNHLSIAKVLYHESIVNSIITSLSCKKFLTSGISFFVSESLYILSALAHKQKSINFKTVVFHTLFPVSLPRFSVKSTIKLTQE